MMDPRRTANAGGILLTVAAAAFLCAAPATAKDKDKAQDTKGHGQDGGPAFEVVVELDQVVFSSEDPVSMRATLYNNTHGNAIVDMAQLGARGKWDLLSTNEQESLESGGWEPARDLEPHPVKLRAHSSLTRYVNLNKQLGQLLREDGKIRVTLIFCDRALGGDSAKPHCTESNGVILTVRRLAKELPIHIPGRQQGSDAHGS